MGNVVGGFKTIPISNPVGRPITTLPGLPTSAPLPSNPLTNNATTTSNPSTNPYTTYTEPQATPTQPSAPEYTAISIQTIQQIQQEKLEQVHQVHQPIRNRQLFIQVIKQIIIQQIKIKLITIKFY